MYGIRLFSGLKFKETVQEEAASDTEETDAEEDSADETETEDTAEEVNEYGFTASDFNLSPYDVNDLFHYNESGEYTGDDPEYIADEIKSMLEDGSLTFPATLEEAGYELKTEHDTLTNAVYKGIAGYLNSLDIEECAELLAHLCLIKNENTEYVDVLFYEGASLAASQPTMTVFDKVITENLQF